MQTSSVLLLFALFVVAFAQDPTGSSYCNDGVCNTALAMPCDLGFCCTSNYTAPTPDLNGTCISELPTYESGGACDATNPCMACPTGEVCMDGNCTTPEPPECTGIFGCPCEDNTDCATSFCASDDTCRSTGLATNDVCIDDDQCLSGICNTTTGMCQGLTEGESCSPLGNPCAYGLYCSGSFLEASCTNGSMVGQDCETSAECFEFGASCAGGECVNVYSQAEGDDCSTSTDCAFGHRCNDDGECASIEGEQCNGAFCPDGFWCQCDGENTHCVQNMNPCDAQREAVLTCMRTNQCTRSPFVYISEEDCMNHCIQEVADYACCTGCGGEANDVITFPLYFLECGATNSYNFEAPCETCNFPLSTCPSAPTGSGDEDGTETNEDSSAATMVPFLASFAILLSYFF